MLLLGAENGIFLRPILRQMPGLNVTKEWENHLFWRGRDSLPILALLFYFGSPHRIVCESGKLPQDAILLWAVKEIAKISLFPYCSLPTVK